MGDLKDIYGIGKGEAQVVDLRPIQSMVQFNREDAARRSAAKQAKRATKAAALNSMTDKLKVEGWDRHNSFLQEKLDGVNEYVMNEIVGGGETVFADNPKKQAELKSRINDFVSANQWSKNLTIQGDIQLARAGKIEDMDMDSLAEFNKWLDLSPEQQRTMPMPLIKDNFRSVNKILKDDYSKVLEGMADRTVRQGKPDPSTGRISKFDITTTKEVDFSEWKQDIIKDPRNLVNIAAGREADSILDGAGVVGKTMIDENGQEVRNPKYLEEYNRLKEEIIDEQARLYLAPEKDIQTASFAPEHTLEDKDFRVTEVSEGERGFVTEQVPSGIQKFSQVDKVGEIEGKKYYRLGNPIFIDKVTGDKFTSTKEASESNISEGDLRTIQAGTWVDVDFNEPKNVKDINEITAKKTEEVNREFTVQGSPIKNTRPTKIIKRDGTEEALAEGETIKGRMISYHEKKDGKEVVTIETKDGKKVMMEATPEIKKIYSKSFEQIGEKAEVPSKQKTISKSQIKEKAKSSGYGEKEYRKLLEEKGIKITD